jgi:hypothetical protein
MKAIDKYQLPLDVGAITLLVSEIILGALTMMEIIHFGWMYGLLCAFAVAGMCYMQFEDKIKAKQSL